VRVRREGDALHIEGDGIIDAVAWPLAEISVSPRLGSTPRILRRDGFGQIECADSALLESWLPTRRETRVEACVDWLERQRIAILAAAAVTVLATVAFVKFGVPWVAQRVAENMPAAVERHVSGQVVALLERFHLDPSKLPASRQSALQERFADLIRGEPRADQMRLRFVHAPSIGPNAFALPDGRIYMTDELVELAKDDEEILAVLAHEAGHHVHRHGMRQAIESSSVFIATGLLFGDVSGSSIAVALPATLLSNGFSRGHEREADHYAFELLLERGLSPAAFARIMERLSEHHGESKAADEGVAGYLSTHPATPERILAAKAAAAQR
jgi:Zn-dependent protease with chaperone function